MKIPSKKNGKCKKNKRIKNILIENVYAEREEKSY